MNSRDLVSMNRDEPGVAQPLVSVVVAAANEGIPVAAIARITHHALDDVYATLHDAVATGAVVSMPKPDWPATARLADRLPATSAPASDQDTAFLIRQMFKLTALEAGFLVVLLKADRVEKAKLHHIVEQQRHTRSAQPSAMEATDPKMVDVMICKLRKKLKVLDEGFVITTIWGGGYHIAPDVKNAIAARLTGVPHDATLPVLPIVQGAARAAAPGPDHGPV